MKFFRKNVYLLIGSVILAICLGTGCAKTNQDNRKEKVVEKFCEEIFTYPS